MLGQGQLAGCIYGDAFSQQQLTLDPVAAFAAGVKADLAAGIHHPLPGNGRRQLEPPQGPAHLAGGTPDPNQLSDLAVGGQLTARDLGHDGVNPLIKRGGGSLHRERGGRKQSWFEFVQPSVEPSLKTKK